MHSVATSSPSTAIARRTLPRRRLPGAVALSLGIALLLAACSTATVAPPFPTSTPEQVGLSSARLAGIDAFITRMQSEHKVAGAVTLLARRGKLVSLKAHGLADLEAQRAMRVDDLFQLQSMTKPIATVAALQLMERGLLRLSDPVEKIPARVRGSAGRRCARRRARWLRWAPGHASDDHCRLVDAPRRLRGLATA